MTTENGSNSVNMTFEEKVVQHIKAQSIAVLLDDEDALTDLTRRAVQEALFKDREVKDGSSWHTKKVPSVAVAAAMELAEKAFGLLVEKEIKRIQEDPKSMEILRSAIVNLLPQVLLNRTNSLMDNIMVEAHRNSMNDLNGIISANNLTVP